MPKAASQKLVALSSKASNTGSTLTERRIDDLQDLRGVAPCWSIQGFACSSSRRAFSLAITPGQQRSGPCDLSLSKRFDPVAGNGYGPDRPALLHQRDAKCGMPLRESAMSRRSNSESEATSWTWTTRTLGQGAPGDGASSWGYLHTAEGLVGFGVPAMFAIAEPVALLDRDPAGLGPARRRAALNILSSTGWMSEVERPITSSTSLVAVWYSSNS